VVFLKLRVTPEFYDRVYRLARKADTNVTLMAKLLLERETARAERAISVGS